MQVSLEDCGEYSRRHPKWSSTTIAEWDDWKWQMRHRVGSIDDLNRIVALTSSEAMNLDSSRDILRIGITPYFASLLDPDDPFCPIRKQVVPSEAEMREFPGGSRDPLEEDRDTPEPGIVHRYPDRAGILVTTECASYCRFCTRSRLVGKPFEYSRSQAFAGALRYIREHKQIRDVLLTGGDALILSDNQLNDILQQVRSIAHVDIVRISTRVPIFVPQRVTEELVSLLRAAHPLWINIHCNHPKELTATAGRAIARLADGGFPLGAQSVLMAGVNDCPIIMRELMRALVRHRVRPYYLYLCDPVTGSGHFRTPLNKGIEIIEHLRGHVSGYAVPTLVVDMPGGGGKVPVSPNYVISSSVRNVVLRNFEGMISACPEPQEYRDHDPELCKFCRREAASVKGVAGTMHCEGRALTPSDWRNNSNEEKQ